MSEKWNIGTLYGVGQNIVQVGAGVWGEREINLM